MSEAEITTSLPTVSVTLKRSWGQIRTWVALEPCPHCGTTRHAWPVPRGEDPMQLLGAVLPPCGKGFVLLVRD